MARIQCPECGSPADDQDLACSHCELILNPRAPGGRYVVSQPSIVRALLSPSDWSGVREVPKPPPGNKVHEQVTVRREVSLSGDEVPRLPVSLDVAMHPLHPFEAYVVSFFDGVTSVHEVSLAAQLRMVEVNAVISSLLERRVIQLERKQPKPAPEAPKPAPEAPRPALRPPPGATPARGSAPATRITGSSPAVPPVPVAQPSRPSSSGGVPSALRRSSSDLGAGSFSPSPEDGVPGELRRSNPRMAPLERPVAPDSAQSALEHAVMLEKKGQVQGAIEVLTRGIAKVPKAAPLYNKLALILLDQRRDFDQAEQLLTQAVGLDPQNSVYQRNLMRVVTLVASAAVKDTEGRSRSGRDEGRGSSGFLSKLWKK